jgi:putative nucleotidyltransferase with HDIG domain
MHSGNSGRVTNPEDYDATLSGMKERILVVNDDDPIREIICSMLTAAGYLCREATGGLNALALLLESEEFDLIVTDLMNDELGGMGLLERTKVYPNTPVVMVAAMNDISVVLAAIRNGAYDYLPMPFEREQLLATVRRALDNRRLKVDSLKYQMELQRVVDIRNEQLQKTLASLEHSYDIALQGFGDALALRDAETAGHSKRVAAFTIGIARAMGLPKDQIAVIARGAFLHDIGKMAIPDAILRKPGPLSSEEFMRMRKHCYHGYHILKKVPFLEEAAKIVYAHHESYDGTGYPRRLKGDEIPLGARFVAVANTLDAVTSDQPYRKARSLAEAREEIKRWSGRQFDPDVVRAFLSMPDKIWQDLSREIAVTHESV